MSEGEGHRIATAGERVRWTGQNVLDVLAQHRDVPPRKQLPRGGIVGQATIVDCVTDYDSDFFVGPYGFVLEDAQALPFLPCKGRLGLFAL